MIGSPKSLTAIVHVKFKYKEPETEPVGEDEVEMVSKILDQASELPRDLQEILVKFADHLSTLGVKTGGQSSE